MKFNVFLLFVQIYPFLLYTQDVKCPDVCASCVMNTSVCTSCQANYFIKEKQCYRCDLENKLFICSSEYFDWNLKIPLIFSKTLYITFNRDFEFSDQKTQISNIFIDISQNISNISYSINKISITSTNSMEIQLNLDVSFRNKSIYMEFIDPFFYFDKENNFLVNTFKIGYIEEFYNYSEINVNGLNIFIYILEGLMLLMFFFMFFSDYFYLFWLFLDSVQTLNVYFLINTNYPPILWNFLNILGIVNFDFPPNFFYMICLKISGSDNLLTKNIDKRFNEAAKTQSFIINFGDLFVVLMVLLIALFFLIGFMKRHAKDQLLSKTNKFTKETADSIHSNVLMIVGKNLEWKVILKYLEVTSFNFLISIMLSLKYASFDNAYGIIDFVLTVIYTVVLTFVLRGLFKILNNTFVFIGNKEHYRKYGILFENIDIKRFWARNFSIIIFLQKFFIVFFLIILYEYGYFQIALVIVTQSLFFMIFLLSLPFYEFKQNILFLTIQGFHIILLFFILGIKVLYEESKMHDIIEDSNIKTQEILAIIAFLFGLLVFPVYFISILIFIMKKNEERRKTMMELGSVSANNSKRTLADKYNMA